MECHYCLWFAFPTRANSTILIKYFLFCPIAEILKITKWRLKMVWKPKELTRKKKKFKSQIKMYLTKWSEVVGKFLWLGDLKFDLDDLTLWIVIIVFIYTCNKCEILFGWWLQPLPPIGSMEIIKKKIYQNMFRHNCYGQ